MTKITELETMPPDVKRALDLILHAGNPEKVILFGSYARGDTHKWSDIDLMIVEETHERKIRRGLNYMYELRFLNTAKDILVRTPFEFENNKNIQNTLEYFVNKDGLILYER